MWPATSDGDDGRMFNYRVTEQVAQEHTTEMRARAESRRRLEEAPVRKRRRLTALAVRRRRDPALAPQWRGC